MKKLLSTLLCLSLILSLSGCGFSFIHEEYTQPEETMPPETYSSEEVAGLEPGTYYYLMEETIEDFETGITTRTEYIAGDRAPRVGLIVYENDVEVRREDWEVDAQNNITKNTVTVNGEVTEVWEYELTYNAYFDILKKVCTLNGQWQYTYDYDYIADPYRLRRIYVEQAGTDNPPWYVFAYKDDRLAFINELYADTPEDYGKNGSSPRGVDLAYDQDGNLENRRVREKNGGFYDVYYEKFAYDGNHVTVTRFDGGPNDLILRAEETYDDAGNLLLREEYSPEGELLRRITSVFTSITIG